MRFSIIFVLVLILSIVIVRGQRWFNGRLLRNPGLGSAFQALSAQDCINQCVLTLGCSAVSFQVSSLKCIKSMCAILDLVSNNGWNTFIVGKSHIHNSSCRSIRQLHHTSIGLYTYVHMLHVCTTN
jgi:hypothetical protein